MNRRAIERESGLANADFDHERSDPVVTTVTDRVGYESFLTFAALWFGLK
jgi:hypothetical protein